MKTKIVEILPSYYFPQANVIRTSCDPQHPHLRPKSMPYKVGDDFECPYDHNAVDDAKGATSQK